MTIKDYCSEHKCNSGECLLRNICPYYMYGELLPCDLSYKESKKLTNDLIKLGKILENEDDD